MCQLLAVTSASTISPHYSLQSFFQRAGNTDEHTDGWGAAFFHEDQLTVKMNTSAAATCKEATLLSRSHIKSYTLIGHIRKATYGCISQKNTHPFVRTLWGKKWVFSHNGDLHNFKPKASEQFKPYGETDSEFAFCYILGKLSSTFDAEPDIDTLVNFLDDISQEIAMHGTFNYLLSNGSLLVAHCSTELYWTERNYPFSEIEFIDLPVSVDLSITNHAIDSMFVIVTKPLTRKEVWQPMGVGEIRAFYKGSLVKIVSPRPKLSVNRNSWDAKLWSSELKLI